MMSPRAGILGLVGIAATTMGVAALDFRSAAEVRVGVDEVVEGDLYASGESVVIDGRVTGDLVAAARSIIVRGTVEGDLMAAGQAVVVEGTVGDDARIAGMALQVAPGASIGDHLMAAGYSLELGDGSRVKDDLVFRGFQALVAGTTGGDATIAAAGLELRGAVEGALDAQVAPEAEVPPFMQFIAAPIPLPGVPMGLTLGDAARVGGDLTYTSAQEGSIAEGAEIAGALTREQPEVLEPAASSGGRVAQGLRRLLTLLVVAGLVLGLVRGPGRQLVRMLTETPGRTLAFGAGAMVLLPVLALTLLLVTVALTVLAGAFSLGALAALFAVAGLLAQGALAVGTWLTVGFLAPLLVAWCMGAWLLARLGSDRGDAIAVLLGVVLLALVLAVPVLGFWVGVLVAVLGLGLVARRLLGAMGWAAAAAPVSA
jgi:cytoskeletal protein CcmA (bactofilin family)